MHVFHRVDTISGLSALAVHAVIAAILISVPPPPPKGRTTIEVDLLKAKPPEPVVTPPKEPDPPPPPKVIEKVKVVPPPVATPVPNKASVEPPKEPPKPVFGLPETALSNDTDGVATQAGNTLNMDPKQSDKSNGKVAPLPGNGTPGAPIKPSYQPVSDVYIKTLPEIDSEACARMVTYPSEAEQLGIEGEVKLKVSLDETGKVHDIKITKGLGHGLDQVALNALKYKCKFKPAIGTDGKAAAYVIQTYTWTFELPR